MELPPQETLNAAPQQGDPVGIVERSMRRAIGDEQLVQKSLAALVEMLKKPTNKFVHLGNTMFLVMVKNPGEVEVHTFSEENPMGLAKNFVDLAKYLQNIGVKKATTYSEDVRFRKIAEMTELPVQIEQSTGMVGAEMRPVYKYTMEF
jgi:hypothetical protein